MTAAIATTTKGNEKYKKNANNNSNNMNSDENFKQ